MRRGSLEAEFLRFHSPIQSTGRNALEDMEIGGKRIAKGEAVGTFLGAANRDPAQFSEPDRLDITRRENRHLAIAFGPHFCLGSALARMEGQIAIGAVLQRLPQIRLEPPLSEGRLEDFPWRQNPVFRGLASLPTTFEAAGSQNLE